MSLINPANNMQFKCVDSLFGRIRRRLKSYDAAGIIDEGDWYWYIKEIIERLGVSVYDEREAIVCINDQFKGPLPEDFSYLYAAYKCKPTLDSGSKQTIFPQHGFVFYIEDTREPYRKCKNCTAAKIDYISGEKITIRTYMEGQPQVLNFNNPRLLRLTGNAKGIHCSHDCKNLFCNSPDEITIDKQHVYTNFRNDSIYMKYYALPIDEESGLPMIIDSTWVEKALEDYIVYRVMENLWFNGEAPDIDKRYQVAKLNSDDSFKSALYYCKLPSFQVVINKIRVDRKNLSVYQQTDF